MYVTVDWLTNEILTLMIQLRKEKIIKTKKFSDYCQHIPNNVFKSNRQTFRREKHKMRVTKLKSQAFFEKTFTLTVKSISRVLFAFFMTRKFFFEHIELVFRKSYLKFFSEKFISLPICNCWRKINKFLYLLFNVAPTEQQWLWHM